MKFKRIVISEKVEKKILSKHNIQAEEIINSIYYGKSIFNKAKHGNYIVFTKHRRYLTIVFKFNNGEINIITTYPSSKWQIKKHKKGK